MRSACFALVLLTTVGFGETPVIASALKAYRGGDYATAWTLFSAEAKSGNRTAQYYLGRMHLYGHGTEIDRSAAAAS